MKRLISKSESDTFLIGINIGKALKAGDVVACYGELGSGKTALSRGIAAAFGIEGVHSPTFTLVNEYSGEKIIYHFDAYRIDADGWADAGFDEYLFGSGICIIEWADNLEGILPENTIKISISRSVENEDYREITIEGDGY